MKQTKIKKKARRVTAKLTRLDGFLKEEGNFEHFETIAINEVLAWQSRKRRRFSRITSTPVHRRP
jgi:hypothetical protein